MTLHLSPIALVLTQSFLFGQSTGTLTGRITDAVTHQPLPDVYVSALIPSRSASSRTGADGVYSLENVPAGFTLMVVRLEGYSPLDDKAARLEFTPGSAAPHDFQLHPMGRIYGSLVDRDTGDLIKGHTVSAVSKLYVPGRYFFFSPGQKTPDRDSGEFNISNLSAGDYLIEIGSINEAETGLPPEAATPKDASPKSYGQSWYPDVPRIDTATIIHLAEGESRHLVIGLKSHETHTLSGIIRTPPEFERQSLSFVFRTSGTHLEQRKVQMSAPGNFRIGNLAPGTYRLAFSAGKTPDEAFGDYSFEITDHDIDDFKVVLAQGAGIIGDVRLAEKDAKLPDKLHVFMVPTSGWLRKLPRGFIIDGLSLNSGALVDSGQFHTESIRPGEYWPQLMDLPEGYAVTQVLFDGSTSRYSAMNLRTPRTPIEFIITSRPGVAAGVVRDENQSSVSGASIVLLPEITPDKLGADAIRTVESGDDGTFVFKSLAPGKYKAFVLSASDSGQTGDADYLRERAARSKSFEVNAGQLVTVDLKR